MGMIERTAFCKHVLSLPWFCHRGVQSQSGLSRDYWKLVVPVDRVGYHHHHCHQHNHRKNHHHHYHHCHHQNQHYHLWKSMRWVTLSKLRSLVLTTPCGSTNKRCFLPLPCVKVNYKSTTKKTSKQTQKQTNKPASQSTRIDQDCPGSLAPRSRRPSKATLQHLCHCYHQCYYHHHHHHLSSSSPSQAAPQHPSLRSVHGTSPLQPTVPSTQLLEEDGRTGWQLECLQSRPQEGPRRRGTCRRGLEACAAAAWGRRRCWRSRGGRGGARGRWRGRLGSSSVALSPREVEPCQGGRCNTCKISREECFSSALLSLTQGHQVSGLQEEEAADLPTSSYSGIPWIAAQTPGRVEFQAFCQRGMGGQPANI